MLKNISLRLGVGVFAVAAAVLSFVTPAYAQTTTIDAEAEVLGFFGSGIGQVVAIVLAVAAAGLSLFVLNIGLKMVTNLLKARGQKLT